MLWDNTRRLIVMIALVIAALVLMQITAPDRVRLTGSGVVVREVLAPVQAGLSWIGEQAGNVLSWPVTLYRAGKYNKILEDEVANLKSEVILLDEYRQENERLTALLDFKQVMAESHEMKAAKVIGREPGSWFGIITLNRGHSDGVDVNMAVLTRDGLVGRVVSVTHHTCDVLLITDPRSGIGALIQETRITGIVEGSNASSTMVTMIHIPNSEEVLPGQVVITSGLGSIYPKNLPIGRITNIYSEPSGLFINAEVQLFADLTRLEEVLIILNAFQ